MHKQRVLVAMSGGVDSSVAAARVVAAGHDAVGVHMALNRDPAQHRVGSRGCCTVEDAFDARRVADRLGIPFYVWDMSTEFTDAVMADFVNEYREGRTPNPCVRCNERIKFAELMRRASQLGFDAVATGHYARVEQTGAGPVLRRAVDMAKDQSYVLAVMGREALGRSMFPLGDAPDKDHIRAEAAELGLRTADKPDSHDICFIPDGDTRGFLDRHIDRVPGPIVDSAGNTVGEHDGAVGYTVGQRRGLRLGTPAPDGKPRYVLDISVTRNEVRVGSAEDLLTTTFAALDPIWLVEPAGQLSGVYAQVRAHGTPFAVDVACRDDGFTATASEPLPAVAAGQTIVIYDGDRAILSGTLDAPTTGELPA